MLKYHLNQSESVHLKELSSNAFVIVYQAR